METNSYSPLSEVENRVFPYDAIVILPYTRKKRDVNPADVERNNVENLPGPRTTYSMSHFTSRAVLAGRELYEQQKAPFIILPGEENNPATSDLEKDYLIKNGIDVNNIFDFPNLNGTQQQLDPIADLQKNGSIGKVLIVSFEFHKERVKELMRRWGIQGDVAEVEQTHVEYLREQNRRANEKRKVLGEEERKIRANRDTLVNLPALEPIKKAEHGIAIKLMKLDKPFGRKAPFSRIAKTIMGPTITDIQGGKVKVGLVRIEKIRKALFEAKQKLTHPSQKL